jgi:nitrite reductase (NADH) small subunit/3-phenylpropionate/trans-cinnamate dioxygenase ferredoxin subunit
VSEQRAASLADVTPGTVRLVDVDGRPIVLARAGSAVYACAAVCSHRGGPLGEGRLTGTRLTCPWHGWSYDVRTGQCLFPGRGAALDTYPVRVDGDDIWVRLG